MEVVAIPTERKFRPYPIDTNKCLFVSDEDPFNIIFFLHDKKDEDGYGGRVFEFETVDGVRMEVKGPWSSRPSIIRDVAGIDLEEYLDDEDDIRKFRWVGLVPCDGHTPVCNIQRVPFGDFTGTGFCIKCGVSIRAVYDNQGQYVGPA